MPKAWCRDPESQFAFDAEHSVCWPTYRLAQERRTPKFEGYDDATKAAVQLSARFREGREPDFAAGLDLEGQQESGGEQRQAEEHP